MAIAVAWSSQLPRQCSSIEAMDSLPWLQDLFRARSESGMVLV